MSGYGQAQRTPAQPKSARDDAADHRTAAPIHSPLADGLAGSLNRSPRSLSLLQLRQTLDGSPRLQSQLALQRALDGDPRPAAPVKKEPIKEKPSLQRKGMQLGGDVVQKVAVERVNLRQSMDRPAAIDASSQVIQAAEVTVHRHIDQNSQVSEELLQTAIEAVKEIVEQVEKSGGAENSGPEHQRLAKMLDDEKIKSQLPNTSNATFGLGGSNYLTPFTTTQGSAEFGTAVSSHSTSGSTQHLGARETGIHDEMHHISEYPGLEALASSQGHCFFCFGTIHGRGYQHGAIRNAPWPQDWRHDYLGFKLKQTSQNPDSIEHAYDPVIKITAEGHGTRYYFVSKA